VTVVITALATIRSFGQGCGTTVKAAESSSVPHVAETG
jgi:hypothetical protein